MPLVDDIADAVAEELNREVANARFVAEHRKNAQWDLSQGELDKLKCAVVDIPAAAVTRASRGKHNYDYTVHVIFRVRVNDDDYRPGLMRDLVEEAIDHFRNLQASDEFPYKALRVIEEVMYEMPEDLREMRLFNGAFGLVYRVTR